MSFDKVVNIPGPELAVLRRVEAVCAEWHVDDPIIPEDRAGRPGLVGVDGSTVGLGVADLLEEVVLEYGACE